MSVPDQIAYREDRIEATLDLGVYRLVAVQNAAYALADRCTVVLGARGGEHLPVTFMFRPGTTEATARETMRLFYQEMLDQELRARLRAETEPLRALILAHAYSRTDLVARK